MFSQNDIQEGETDVPGNIHGVSLNKEVKKGASATECFPLSTIFTKESKRIHNLNQQKSHANLSPKANQTKKKMI